MGFFSYGQTFFNYQSIIRIQLIYYELLKLIVPFVNEKYAEKWKKNFFDKNYLQNKLPSFDKI